MPFGADGAAPPKHGPTMKGWLYALLRSVTTRVPGGRISEWWVPGALAAGARPSRPLRACPACDASATATPPPTTEPLVPPRPWFRSTSEAGGTPARRQLAEATVPGSILGFALGVAGWMVGAVEPAVPAPSAARPDPSPSAVEHRITRGPGGRILTNIGAWSPDGRWLVYDVRSDASGEVFDGPRIEAVEVETGAVRVLYEGRNGARCGVVTCHPSRRQAVFIHGPENPTPEWSYGPYHREGLLVDWETPGGEAVHLDARDLAAPFTPGALRGGSHVHVFSPDGRLVSFTYEDHVLAVANPAVPGLERNQRNIGVSVVDRPVSVGRGHPRNHDGTAFTVLVTRTVDEPRPGSDEIAKAFEEGWVGVRGYVRADGSRQRYALAFLGHVITEGGRTHTEVFVADLPDDLTTPGDGPLQGTSLRRPVPPRGVVQRRLTHTADRRHPGVQGTRHWLRSAPDGSRIAFLMKDDAGVVQLWTVSPRGGPAQPLTRNPHDVASTFTWSPDGRWIAHTMDGSVCVTGVARGETHRLTARAEGDDAPRPEACVFSPDSRRIAFVRRPVEPDGRRFNQICVVELR
jgi:hypothetical protein